MPKLQKRSEKSKSQPHPETLKGWKQISEFLGEPVSVVKRWAAGGMPLHREGQFVSTSSNELNAWVTSIPLVSQCVVRIQFNRPLEFLLCAPPIPIVCKEYAGQCRMRLHKSVIQLQCLHRCGLREWHFFSRWQRIRWHMVTVSQPRVSSSVTRVSFDRGLKVPDRFLHAIRCPFIPVVSTLQIELISLSILRGVSSQPFFLLTLQPQAQLVGDFTGNIFLHGEDVRKLAVVPPAPQFRAIPDVHQLHGDSQRVAPLRDFPR